jgi:hypothetical protein
MSKVLIMPCIGVVLILLLRTHKQKEQLQILELNETEYRSNKGSETNYLPFTRTPENKQRKDSQGFNSN